MAAEQNPGVAETKVAQFVRSGEGDQPAQEVAPGIWESRGVGNSYLVVTNAGDVLVNAGTLGDARRGKERFARVSGNPVHTIVLTQSHANQYGGLEVYKTDANRVIAHRIYAEDRHHGEMLADHYRRGSRRIFGGITGRPEDMVPTREVVPDLLIGDHGYSFELGGRRFEILWTPGGETRSAVVVWLPGERVAIVGNLFGPLFGNHPNLNTIRGDKPRSALEFIASIRSLQALEPELILTGHEAIRGAANIRAEIERIASAVQWVHDRTIEGMNEGKDVRTLMREVCTPPELTLTEEYGRVAWNVRAIWHEYTGWFDPSRGTTDLYGVPPSSVAPTIADLAGGADRIAEAASYFVAQDKPLEALHLLDIALAAAPGLPVALRVKRDALALLRAQSDGKNLWEQRWIAAELRDAAE